jgi:hypothetical protein
MKKETSGAYTNFRWGRYFVGDAMNEGWLGDDYLILFDEGEVVSASARYAISQLLPGYQVLGLRGWDDFILRDSGEKTYSVPTVPSDPKYVSPFQLREVDPSLRPDPRFSGRIKWYVKPIAFGGDPSIGTNLTWVSHEQHAQLVRWWNDQYRSLKGPAQTPA